MSPLAIFLIVFASIFFLYEVISLIVQIVKRVKEKKEKSEKEDLLDGNSN